MLRLKPAPSTVAACLLDCLALASGAGPRLDRAAPKLAGFAVARVPVGGERFNAEP